MELVNVKLKDLVSPSYNPRVISLDEMEKLKNSLVEFDYVSPLVVNKVNNHIVGGNQRYYAMLELGYTNVDVVYINETDLNREKALNVALNKISGDWDYPKLNTLLSDLELSDLDISLTGFDNLDLNSFGDDLSDLDFDITDDDGAIGTGGSSSSGGGSSSGGKIYRSKASLIVESEDPSEIEELYHRLTEEGYDCRIRD